MNLSFILVAFARGLRIQYTFNVQFNSCLAVPPVIIQATIKTYATLLTSASKMHSPERTSLRYATKLNCTCTFCNLNNRRYLNASNYN